MAFKGYALWWALEAMAHCMTVHFIPCQNSKLLILKPKCHMPTKQVNQLCNSDMHWTEEKKGIILCELQHYTREVQMDISKIQRTCGR